MVARKGVDQLFLTIFKATSLSPMEATKRFNECPLSEDL